MILEKIVLNNYRQHTFLEKLLTGNIIGIIGKNASGKSNLLGAIQFALTGEHPGVKKADLITWGKTTGSVELHFFHNNKPGKIYRELHSNNAILIYNDEKITKITSITEKLKEFFDIDKDLLKQAVFVRQAEIDSILFSDPKTRELAFQKLCGIYDASKIYRILSEKLNTIFIQTDELDLQIDTTQKTLNDIKERKEILEFHLEHINKQIDKYEYKNFEDLLNTCNLAEQVIHSLFLNEKNLEQITNELSEIEQKLLQTPGENNLQERLNVIEQNIQQLKQKKEIAIKYEQLVNHLETITAKIDYTQNRPPVSPKNNEDVLQKISSELNQLQEIYKQLLEFEQQRKLFVSAKELNLKENLTCPLCGNEIKEFTHIQTKYEELITKGKQLFAEFWDEKSKSISFDKFNNKKQELESNFNKLVTARNKYYADVAAWEAEINTLKEQAAKIIKEMNNYPRPELTIVEIDDLINSAVKEQQNLINRQITINILSDQKIALQEKKSKIESTINGINLWIDDNFCKIGLDPFYNKETLLDDIAKIRQEILNKQKQLNDLFCKKAELTGQLTELQATADTLSKTLQILHIKKTEREKAKTVYTTLKNVKEWFNYSNGPKIITSTVLNAMINDINQFLEKFRSDFYIVPSEDDAIFGFNCIFHKNLSKVISDLTVLSGGQRIQLALSLRFANYCIFAKKLGFISLDEPTVYLDDEHINQFCVLLENLKTIAKELNLQIFIATHERSVIPFMDNIVDLNA